MRATAVLLVLLLAGCGAPADEPRLVDQVVYLQAQMPNGFDGITDRLDPASATFQDFLVDEDTVAVGGNGSMTFQTGRGMFCAGDVDSVAPNVTGWVACMVRLVREPTAQSQDVHELGIGHDVQRLTLRQAAEPVEWRFVVSVVHDKNASVAFDSGWRLLDLSPVLEDPLVTVELRDPCDRPDAREQAPSGFARQSGLAILVVEGVASHGKPFIEVDLGGRSRPMLAESTPFADHATYDHAFAAFYGPFAAPRAFRLELPVDLEAPESPAPATGGPCSAPAGGETQEWTVDVGLTGADGAVEYKSRSVRVDVVLDAAP